MEKSIQNEAQEGGLGWSNIRNISVISEKEDG
jgi:hypothetical protein